MKTLRYSDWISVRDAPPWPVDPEGFDIRLHVRAGEGAQVYALAAHPDTGEVDEVLVAEGTIFSVETRLVGFSEVVVRSGGPVAFKMDAAPFLLIPWLDPKPHVVNAPRRPVLDPVELAMEQRIMDRLRAQGVLTERQIEEIATDEDDFELDEEDEFTSAEEEFRAFVERGSPGLEPVEEGSGVREGVPPSPLRKPASEAASPPIDGSPPPPQPNTAVAPASDASGFT